MRRILPRGWRAWVPANVRGLGVPRAASRCAAWAAACAAAVWALLPTAACAAQPTVLVNATGVTLSADGRFQSFDALAFDAHGQVIAIGRAAAVRAVAKRRIPRAVELDLHGQLVMPGLIDAHGHTVNLGLTRRSLSLRKTANLTEALQAIAAHTQSRPESPWVTGGGWNQANWKLGRFPTAQELDSVTAGKPALLYRIDGHAAWANSAALALAGITAATPDPDGGRIERDAAGQPTGVLIDGAMGLVARHVPPNPPAEMRAAFDVAQRELLSMGITAVHDAGVSPSADAMLRGMAQSGELRLRIHGMLGSGYDEFFRRMMRDGPLTADDPRSGGGRYTLRAIKLFADGALGSRGAALLAPYSDAPHTHGLLFFTDADLMTTLRQAATSGFQINVHAIGDAANRQVLQGFEQLQRELGRRSTALRHRVEHAQILALADLQRFARAGVIASVQPTHATSDMNMAEDRVGPARIRGGYAWQRLRAHGARLACGSDFPIESPNPWEGLYAAITRQDLDGQPAGGWYADQVLTREQALACFTQQASYASHTERRWGRLAVGQQADFIVVDRDVRSARPLDLARTQVKQTWVGGERVF